MHSLNRDACLAFLGMAPCSDRLQTYRRLSTNLTPQARHFFDGQKRAISGGIWHSGLWERLLRWNARFLSFRIGAVSALMRAPSIEDQSRLFDQHFRSSTAWSKVEAIGRDLVWRLAMREPAAAFLPDAREVSARIDADFRNASQSFLFRESDIATLALNGRHSAHGPLPIHLRKDTYEKVRGRLERIRLVTGGLADLPNLNVGRFDGFSLSDFGSYCDLSDYTDSWEGIVQVALPGARFCERLFLNIMPPQSDRVMIDETLSGELSLRDRSIIYRVRAGVLRAC